MHLRTEKYYPLMVGLLASAGMTWWKHRAQWQPPTQIHDLLPAIINVAAIAVGFLSAAMAILFAISGSPMIVHLKDVDYYRHVVGYMLAGIAWAFLLALACGGAMLIDPAGYKSSNLVFSVIVGLLITASLSYVRVLRVFSSILLSNEKTVDRGVAKAPK